MATVSDSLWTQVFVNAVGPVVSVALGTVLVGGVVAWLQRRGDRRRWFRDLTKEMFEIAYSFYVTVEDAARRRRYGEPEPPESELDQHAIAFSVAARTIEAQLRLAGRDRKVGEIRWVWHCCLDLLTLMFFFHRHTLQRINDLRAGQDGEHATTDGRESVQWDVVHRYLDGANRETYASSKASFGQAMDRLIALTELGDSWFRRMQ